MAGMCRVWLVEPPVACSATIALTMRLLVDDLADRREVAVRLVRRVHLMRGFAGQRIAQRRVRVDEGGARQVQAHHLHQHLVGVGGAVEGAGAGAVVGLHLRFQQLFARSPCLRRSAGARRLFPCWRCPMVIGPAGTKIVGRWPKRSAPISRPGTILSQMPSISAASNMLCDSATAVRHGDHVAARTGDSSMPGSPWVTPSHIAGMPPANCADRADFARGVLRSCSG